MPLAGRDEDELLKGFNQLWRRNIKKADKAGVEVTLGRPRPTCRTFHALYLETAERDHFTGRPLSYFQRMWAAMRAEDPDRIRLYLAAPRGRPGGRDDAGAGRRGTPGTPTAPRRRRSARCAAPTRCSGGCCATRRRPAPTVYDLRGITDTLAEDDPHFGLIQFKLGTGGEAVEYLGEWDLPLNKVLFKAFEVYMDASTGERRPMTFTLYVDEDRWRAHLPSVVDATPGIVPVIKGNGYGLGNARLAAEAARLGVDTVAVGTTDELPEVRRALRRRRAGADARPTRAVRGRPDRPGDPDGRAPRRRCGPAAVPGWSSRR